MPSWIIEVMYVRHVKVFTCISIGIYQQLFITCGNSKQWGWVMGHNWPVLVPYTFKFDLNMREVMG